jgi:hypothetical protein
MRHEVTMDEPLKQIEESLRRAGWDRIHPHPIYDGLTAERGKLRIFVAYMPTKVWWVTIHLGSPAVLGRSEHADPLIAFSEAYTLAVAELAAIGRDLAVLAPPSAAQPA